MLLLQNFIKSDFSMVGLKFLQITVKCKGKQSCQNSISHGSLENLGDHFYISVISH